MEMDNGTYYMKPMNCPMHCLIYRSRQRSLPRAPAAPVRARQRVPLRTSRHAARSAPHPWVHPGRQPHLLHAGAVPGRGRVTARLRDQRAAGLRVRGLHLQPVDEGPREVRRLRRDLGTRHRRSPLALERYGLEYKIKEGRRRLLRSEDRHRRPGRDRTVVAAVHDPGRLQQTRSASSWSTWRGQLAQASDHVAPRLFGSVERFFGVLLEHYAGAFPTGSPPSRCVSSPWPRRTRSTPARSSPPGGRRPACRRCRGIGPVGQAHPGREDGEDDPYLVVGDDDVAAGTLGVNPRGGEVERGVPVDTFLDRVRDEITASEATAGLSAS